MIFYNTDRSDPAKDVSAGSHINSADTPEEFSFSVDHTKGADRNTIIADIEAHLVANSRTAELKYKEPKFRVTEHDSDGQVTRVRYYATDNGDGTYSDLVEEDEFSISGGKLINEVNKRFDPDGSQSESTQHDYFTQDSGNLIRKKA